MRKAIGGIVLVIALAVALIFGIKLFPLFKGGNGDGTGVAASASEGMPSQSDSAKPDEDNMVSEIRIVRNDIFLDDELCENVVSLKQRIIESDLERQYIFTYDEALVSTYDDVNTVLAELRETLGITIIVNE